MRAERIEAVPLAIGRSVEALEEVPAIVDEHVVLTWHVVSVEACGADDLPSSIEFLGLRQVRHIAGVQHEQPAAARQGAHFLDRRAERCVRVGVRVLVEADMAIADLDERETPGFRRGDRIDQAERPRHTALQRPDDPGAAPCRTSQQRAAIQATCRPIIDLRADRGIPPERYGGDRG